MDRRTCFRTLAGAAGAALALPAALRAGALTDAPPRGRPAAARLERVGLQLYSLRDAARVDLERTLADIAAIGYRDVELLDSMRNFGMPTARLRGVLDRVGLRAPSTHIDTAALGDVPRLAADAHALGHESVVVASLPLGTGPVTLDDYRRWADRLNAGGGAVRREGLWLAFHNEQENFHPVGGRVPYDVLIERLDPARVRLQFDTGNAAIGGADPMAYLARYADRFWSYHLKDAPAIGAAQDAELGAGVLDVRRMLAAMGPLEGKHVFVEQESYPGAPIESVRRDYAYAAGLTF